MEGMVTTMEDILENGLWKKFFENSPSGFCIIKLEPEPSGFPKDFKIIYANKAFLELEGLPEEELFNRSFPGIFPSPGEEYLQKCYEAAYKGKVNEIKFRSVHTEKYIKITCYPLSDGMCGCIARDISVRRRHEAEEQRYMDMLHGLSKDYYILYILDMESGNIDNIHVKSQNYRENVEIFEKWGFTKGMKIYANNFIHEADRDMILKETTLEAIKSHLSGEDSYRLNYRKISGNTTKYMQIKFNKIGTDKNFVKAGVGFRSAEAEMRHEMEQKAAIEEALQQAKKASKAKTDFLSNMSHDIRTPMNAIVGFAAIAAGHIDNKEKVQDCLTKIMVSSNHLLALINDVLDMSRIESGRISIHEQEANLSELMHDFMNMIQPQIADKNQELYIDTMDVLHEDVYVDIQRLERVLVNIAGNAVKYTDAGGTISVRLREIYSDVPGEGKYIFSIKDTGIGMSDDFLPHVFDVFERERNTTISKIEGTGLGLPIAKSIVEIMGGTISVKSKRNKGSEFIITLPLKLQKDTARGMSVEKLAGLRAMIVDDDFNVCDSVSKMLFKIGMEPEWTLSGKEAVLKAQQAKETGKNYYAYIVDWKVPDMDGIEIIKRLRSIAGNDTPIYVLTAYDYTDIEEEARAAGVTAFWQKPLFLSSLRSVLLQSCGEPGISEPEPLFKVYELFRGKKILLVEDNELNCEIATEILAEAGFIIDKAENGSIAVEKIKNSTPGTYDIVLMDIQMPVMNGYEATSAIRSLDNKELSEIPVLAMTANAFEEDKQRAIDNGMNGHIAKPIEIDKLFETLKGIFI